MRARVCNAGSRHSEKCMDGAMGHPQFSPQLIAEAGSRKLGVQ